MLGILQVNEQKNKNKIVINEIFIEGVKFLEIIVDLKYDSQNFLSKITINKAFKVFWNRNVRKICLKSEFYKYLQKYSLKAVTHDEILYVKRYDILKSINKKTIFVYSNSRDISDMIDFLARNFDNIFLNIKIKDKQIKQEFLLKYGVSVMEFNPKYKPKEGVFLCFDKPRDYFYGDIILNLSCENFPLSCIDDIVCTTELYKGNTDITAICDILVKNNLNNVKNINMKKFIINT